MLSLFRGKSAKKCGLIIDIGSGSVGAAIVIVDPDESGTQTVWSYRESAPRKSDQGISAHEKAIATTLLNVCLEVNANGTPLLRQRSDNLQITDVQVSIAAPFAHTVTKTVRYKNEIAFKVTDALVVDLADKAEQQVHEQFAELGLEKQNLSLINNATIHITANEYTVTNPLGQNANSVALTHLIAVTSKTLLRTINESLDSLAPDVPRTYYSYMFLFFCSERNRRPNTTNVCLVDITLEAIEVGIVRDGVLAYVSHAPFGTYTMAREVATAAKLTTEEAYAYLQNTESATQPSKKVAEALTAVKQEAQERWSELLQSTGDALGIPAVIELHTAHQTDEFCADQLTELLTTINRTDVVVRKTPHNPAINGTALHLATDFFADHVDCKLEIT